MNSLFDSGHGRDYICGSAEKSTVRASSLGRGGAGRGEGAGACNDVSGI